MIVAPGDAIVEPAQWRSAPWGNPQRQGTSHEIWRAPDGSGGYLARASIAEIDAAGPFTALPGFRRWLAVLDDGGGLELAIADGAPRRWCGAAGDTVTFDGAAAVHATITRPARVWNLIVREHVPWSAAWHAAPGALTVPGGVALVHAVTSGLTRIATAAQPIEITVDSAPAIVAHVGLGGC